MGRGHLARVISAVRVICKTKNDCIWVFLVVDINRYKNKCGGGLLCIMNTHLKPPTNKLHKHQMIEQVRRTN
jgi:hypothetical protein